MKLWDLLVGIAAVIGVLTTILTGLLLTFKGARRLFFSTVGRKSRLYRLLESLAPDVQIQYFEGMLGPAAFRNSSKDVDEFIFINPYFFVQAITDKDGRILAYTVTLRRGKFHPQLWGRGLPNSSASVVGDRLGKFTFAEFAKAEYPIGVVAELGARRWQYVESYYFGNPGLYQWYLIGINDAGISDADTFGVISLLQVGRGRYGHFADTHDQRELQAFLQRPENEDFRATARPNMYGVTNQGGLESIRARPIGPDLDQVRVLPS